MIVSSFCRASTSSRARRSIRSRSVTSSSITSGFARPARTAGMISWIVVLDRPAA